MSRPQGILQLDLSDRSRLYMAYMPFVQGGGIFVPTEGKYKLGDEVFVLVRLPDSSEFKGVAGKVVWITPHGASSPHTQGIGIQFSAQDHGELHRQIENLLAGTVASERPTHTL